MIYDFLKIDPHAKTPIWQQLLAGLEQFCHSVPPDTSIPAERELAAQLGVSRTTLRQAIKAAESRNLLLSRWGKGMYVAEPPASRRILVIISDRYDISMPRNYIIPGIEQRATQLGLQVEIIASNFLRSQPVNQIKKFFTHEHFLGILHMDYVSWHEAAELEALRQLDIPLLFPHAAETWAQAELCPTNIIDERRAFADALKLLVQLGHRHIATLNSCIIGNTIRGYNKAEYFNLLKNLGADPDPDLLCFVNYNDNSIGQTVKLLYHHRPDVSAMLCFSDFFALKVYQSLTELGLQIPDDISVMGFCGYPGDKYLAPGLSTVDFHYREIGRHAVDRLLSIPPDWRRRLTPDELIEYSPYEVVQRHSLKSLIS